MKNLQLIIDESINYELDTYNAYVLFSKTFKDDSVFWENLAEEELNHVSVLRKSLSFHQGNMKILNSFSVKDIETVKECRKNIQQLINQFKKNPTPEMACNIAMEIEEAAVEKNYQKFMSKVTNDSVLNLFQTLNGEEKDHLKRIKKYFSKVC
jgi:rubrerythrin